MIDEGEQAPTFELPAVVDGEFEEITLDEYLGEKVVILAFYPADFNPACGDGTTDLDELDLFTMQKDVSILAISGDSIYSHRAFADEYALHIPLLSDTKAAVAEQYGVAADADGYLTRRAIAVINPKQQVEYTWVADDIDDLPDTEAIRDVVEGVGGDDTAEARYGVGYAHYIEARRAFTSAMSAFEDREWMLAEGDFERAYEEFDRASDEFNTAVRFGEDEEKIKYFERAERKAESLWRASEWLSESAGAFASGEGAKADSMRQDAEAPLEAAREIHDPPDPDEFPPEEDPAGTDGDDDGEEILLEEPDEADETAIDADIDAEAETDDDTTPPATEPADEDDEDDESSIDDEELEEIAAELEEQTEAAKAREAEDDDDQTGTGGIVPDNAPEPPQARTNSETIGEQAVEDQPDAADDTGADDFDDEGLEDDFGDEDDIELDLTDPDPDMDDMDDLGGDGPDDPAGADGERDEVGDEGETDEGAEDAETDDTGDDAGSVDSGDESTELTDEPRIQFGDEPSADGDDTEETDETDE